MAYLAINPDGLQRLRDQRGLDTDTALADFIDIHQSNIGRVLRGEAKPSNKFITGIAVAFGYDVFPMVFTVTEDTQKQAAA
jgi:transcriptional regulator with XRE-family HTH domain